MQEYNIVNGTAYSKDTSPAVVDVLERARESRRRIRFFYGDTITGSDCMEEYDTIGCVGRSTGITKIPLIINNSRSLGGPSILDSSIIRIMDIDTKRELYRNPNYNMPELTVTLCNCKEYEVEVSSNNQVVARFPTVVQAERWIAFMKGERFSK